MAVAVVYQDRVGSHHTLLLGVYHFVFTTIFRAGAFDGRSFLLFVAVAWSGLLIRAWIERQTASRARKLAARVAVPAALVLPLCAWVIFFYRW